MIGAAELVSRYGSPLYVYDLDHVEAAHTKLRAALPSPSLLYYSTKANPHPSLARVLLAGGCLAEVSSPGELAVVTGAGAPGASCLYTGPAKTVAEISAALQAGVRRYSVESAADYVRVAEVALAHRLTAECLLRVNVASPAGGAALRMTGRPSQFGVDEEQIHADPHRFAARPGAQLIGAHFFPLSNARSEISLVAAMAASLKSAARLRDELGMSMSVVDLGGGFAAPYASSGALPDYPELRASLMPLLDRYLPGWRRGDVTVAFESGRYLVGTAGRLVCTVMDVKRSRERQFVVLDSGINHLGGLTGLGRIVPVEVATVPSEPIARAALVGPLCTPADVLAASAGVGALRSGQVIEIPNVGAYGLSASLLAFLSRPAPIEVVTQGGEVVYVDRLEVRRQPVARPGDGSHRRALE